MNIIGIIPARMASSRFPGKPLAKICGIPMVGHVYLRSKKSRLLNNVYIATCDEEIREYGKRLNAEIIMTKDTHKRATDRCAEAMLKAEKKTGEKTDIIVMIQGDEPLVRPQMIDAAIRPMLKDKNIGVVNLSRKIRDNDEFIDPNCIKVVVDNTGYAMYFSREAVPSGAKWEGEIPMLKQVCIIPFRRDFLLKFNRLKPTLYEEIESIDMLRVLGHGYKVKMACSPVNTYSVDTPADLKRVEELMLADNLMRIYGRKVKK